MPTATEPLACEFEDVDGHVILLLGRTRTLVDTGSPVTLGRQRAWEFLGAPRQLATRLGPVTMDGLSTAVGTRIDVLLGTDLLSECAFDIDWSLRRVTFADPSNGVGHAVPLTTPLGVPVATGEFGGETRRFVVDTGAVVSFLPRERLEGLRRIGSRRDFHVYPTIETFDTPLYQAPLMLAGDTIDLQWGELPDALAPVQLIATGIVGTELFRQYRTRFDLANGKMWLRNWTRHDSPTSHRTWTL